jgi:hypothetical protein
MKMTTAGRKPIACWLETNAEGGVESTSQGDSRKDWQRMLEGKAGAEEIGGALKTKWGILSENPKSNTHTKYQTNKTWKKTTIGQRLRRRGTKDAGHKRGKMAEEERESTAQRLGSIK